MLSCKLKADVSTDTETKFAALFGHSLHTNYSESYFSESSYIAAKRNAYLILNDSGKITNYFRYEHNTFGRWICNDYCNLEKTVVTDRFYWISRVFVELKPEEIQNYVDKIDICSNSQNSNQRDIVKKICKCGEINCIHTAFDNQRLEPLGHQVYCYENSENCNSILLFFRRMAPHFPLIRQIVKLIYNVRRELRIIRYLTRALENGELSDLREICSNIQVRSHTFTVNSFPFEEENEIYDHFASGFRILRKKESDWPTCICMSCRKLCSESDTHTVVGELYTKPIFNQLITFLHDIRNQYPDWQNTNELCTYCYRKLMQGIEPPTCLLNNLYFRPIPSQ